MPLIYLSRHAQPDRTRTDLPYHLIPGPPLTEPGLQEAVQLGEFFRQVGVHKIIASPLERCIHTARVAAEIAGASLEIEPALGEWQPGEKSEDVRRRMLPVFEKACQNGEGNSPAALVTHGGPIGALLEALGMDRAVLMRQHTYDYGNPVPTAGAWRAEQDSEKRPWKLNLAFVPAISTGAQVFPCNPSEAVKDSSLQSSASTAC